MCNRISWCAKWDQPRLNACLTSMMWIIRLNHGGGCVISVVYYSLHDLNLATGRDVIAQAQSGTGKTATFAISILQQLDVNKKFCQALVLAPTRELAQQIQKVRNCQSSCVFSVVLIPFRRSAYSL